MKDTSRNAQIVKYNLIGIVANIVLSVSKFIIGSLANSGAVVLDAINSFADVIFSALILIFAKLSQREADEKHPFGYGRLEYLCSVIITMLILAIGFRSLYDAIVSIIHPEEAPEYSFLLISVMIISLVSKYFLGNALKQKGRELNSEALEAAGVDNLSDAWVAIAVLVSIVIFMIFHFSIESYLCVGISGLIIKSGIEMMMETLDDIIEMLSGSMTKVVGEPADPEFRKKILRAIFLEEGVYNVSSLIIHNYGEGNYIGSVDIEVDEKMTARQIADLTRRLKRKVAELGMTLTSVGISGTTAHDPKADEIWDKILLATLKHKNIVHAHSFTVDFKKKSIHFTVVQDYGAADKDKDLQQLKEEVEKLLPGMKISIATAINA